MAEEAAAAVEVIIITMVEMATTGTPHQPHLSGLQNIHLLQLRRVELLPDEPVEAPLLNGHLPVQSDSGHLRLPDGHLLHLPGHLAKPRRLLLPRNGARALSAIVP